MSSTKLPRRIICMTFSWTPANITKYVQNPKATVPGNKMAFAGLKTQADINNLLAYLGTFKADGSKK